jgi:hypothetical protein
MTKYKRWYDYDPILLEVLELMRHYPEELKAQAEVFIKKVEEHTSKEALDKFCEMAAQVKGNRWYDKDPVIARTVELLRIVPPEVQRGAAAAFVAHLKASGIEGIDVI